MADIHVDVPGMGVVSFPDTMTSEQIAAAIAQTRQQPRTGPPADRIEVRPHREGAPPAPPLGIGGMPQPSTYNKDEPGPLNYLGWLKHYGGEAADTMKQESSQIKDSWLPVPPAGLGKMLMAPVQAGVSSLAKAGEYATGGFAGHPLLTREDFELASGGIRGGAGPHAAPPPGGASIPRKIFAPETIGQGADAAAALRSAGGRAARDTEISSFNFEPFRKTVNQMSVPDRLDFIDYVEGRSTGRQLTNQQLQPLADMLKQESEKRKTKLQNLSSTAQAEFIEDYFPHFWKDPAKAQQFTQQGAGGAGKQGSGASLKKRTVPTIGDGVAAGLQPLTTDPVEAAMRYITSMDKFIASTEVLDTAQANSTVQYFKPKVMGASGHPDSYKGVPDGWVKVNGRGATRGDGAQAFAPEDWARVYNNYISRGIAEHGEEFGSAYDIARRGVNSVTALELGISGYHAATMAQEAMANEVARAVQYGVYGRPVKAAASLLKSPLKFITAAGTGKKVERVYLGTTPGTQEMREVVDLLTEAGGRARGYRHAPDYEQSAMGSYLTAFKRGALRSELAADAQQMRAAPLTGTAKVAARHIGRTIDTVAQPIFEKYIPLLKNGAFYDNMKMWIEAHPNATREEKIAAARQVWDSADNRFGEMVQDNIFWDKQLKQGAMLAMRSWSWTMGSTREIGGGIVQTAKTAAGKGPKEWTPQMSYIIALPLTYAMLSAAYQYMKTGQGPQDARDLMAPRTGGTDANSGQPERLQMPGYMKDVFGFYKDPMGEALNKMSTAPRAAWEIASNKDWRGSPIRRPTDPDMSTMEQVPGWLQDYFKYISENFGPISVRNLIKGQKQGSNISVPESILGVRTAPRFLMDPEGTDRMEQGIGRRDWKRKQRYDQRQKGYYGED